MAQFTVSYLAFRQSTDTHNMLACKTVCPNASQRVNPWRFQLPNSNTAWLHRIERCKDALGMHANADDRTDTTC